MFSLFPFFPFYRIFYEVQQKFSVFYLEKCAEIYCWFLQMYVSRGKALLYWFVFAQDFFLSKLTTTAMVFFFPRLSMDSV